MCADTVPNTLLKHVNPGQTISKNVLNEKLKGMSILKLSTILNVNVKSGD